jgi:hypothetical protein
MRLNCTVTTTTTIHKPIIITQTKPIVRVESVSDHHRDQMRIYLVGS